MPFPFDFPFDFDAWLSELLVMVSPLTSGPVILSSPLNQGPLILVSAINEAVIMRSAFTTSVELPGRV